MRAAALRSHIVASLGRAHFQSRNKRLVRSESGTMLQGEVAQQPHLGLVKIIQEAREIFAVGGHLIMRKGHFESFAALMVGRNQPNRLQAGPRQQPRAGSLWGDGEHGNRVKRFSHATDSGRLTRPFFLHHFSKRFSHRRIPLVWDCAAAICALIFTGLIRGAGLIEGRARRAHSTGRRSSARGRFVFGKSSPS